MRISSKHSEEILKKMCEWINVDPETVDWEARDWYMQHAWTREQEDKFIEWVANFLITHKYAKFGKKRALYDAGKIVFNYGWKYETKNAEED